MHLHDRDKGCLLAAMAVWQTVWVEPEVTYSGSMTQMMMKQMTKQMGMGILELELEGWTMMMQQLVWILCFVQGP